MPVFVFRPLTFHLPYERLTGHLEASRDAVTASITILPSKVLLSGVCVCATSISVSVGETRVDKTVNGDVKIDVSEALSDAQVLVT